MRHTLYLQLGSVIARYRARYFSAFAVVLGANILLVLNPLVFRYAVTLLDPSGEPDALRAIPLFRSVWSWSVVLLCLATGSALLIYATRMLFAVSRNAEEDLRAELFGRLQLQSQSFFDRHRTGELMSRLTNDLTLYREVLGPGLMYPSIFVSLVVPAIFGLGTISWPLTLVALIPIALLPPLMLFLRAILYRASLRVQESLAEMSTLAQEDYSSIRLIKAYATEGAFSKRFSQLCGHFFKQSIRLLVGEVLLYPLLSLIGKWVTIALVVVAGSAIIYGWSALTRADVVSFMWLQSYILLPVLMLGWVLPVYQKGRSAYERIYQLFSEPVEVERGTKQLRSLLHAPPSISLKGLNFTYPANGGVVLDGVTAEIPAGSFVGLMGPPGSGKTTLFRCLHRDYALARGMIALNGIDIHDYSLEALRTGIAIVEQDPFLFSRTLRENIALACPEATAADIVGAANVSQLESAIRSFPKGYDTFVGERGVTLSGGQRQRVSIARALLVKRPLLLLDDVFSALDSATTASLMLELLRLKGGATVLLATHRASLLAQVDLLLCFAHGRLIQSGTPSQLANAGGPYAALLELEQLTEKEAG